MKVAIFGQQNVANSIREALETDTPDVRLLDTSGLVVLDEWQTRRWFAEQMPDVVFIGLAGLPEKTSRDVLYNSQGMINVMNASLGFGQRLQVYSFFASNVFFVLKRLCEMYTAELQVAFGALMCANVRAISDAAVLVIQDVAAKKAQSSTESSREGGKVRHEVVPEQAGGASDSVSQPDNRSGYPLRQSPSPLLEVPLQNAAGKASSHLRAQRRQAEG